jgi:hypothetical protein
VLQLSKSNSRSWVRSRSKSFEASWYTDESVRPLRRWPPCAGGEIPPVPDLGLAAFRRVASASNLAYPPPGANGSPQEAYETRRSPCRTPVETNRPPQIGSVCLLACGVHLARRTAHADSPLEVRRQKRRFGKREARRFAGPPSAPPYPDSEDNPARLVHPSSRRRPGTRFGTPVSYPSRSLARALWRSI